MEDGRHGLFANYVNMLTMDILRNLDTLLDTKPQSFLLKLLSVAEGALETSSD